ncbi:helix-turn-helix domain-containing protein [Streptomyces fenghuangensis]|uniref:helix-turn-helix domain-containing protein n=1 Tax=Streptomyces sp. ICN903 TaxID=2964654 RepID=UPI001EDC7E9F|nr:helix-turn-helix transcriptional regulator [Streptomyces sp. ICN903]MCG3040807.1 helix-turn-helix domain-containing protein [Streptomyces sp. ICN903]
MTEPRQLDPYASPKTFYGAELRRLREAAGLTQSQLGERAFCSGTYVGQFETAVRRPQPDTSKLFDEILGTGEHLQRLCRLARENKYPDYFADAAELEQMATTISEYAPMLVPGLLQVETYTRAITRAALPLASEEEVEKLVRARMDRQYLLNQSTAPQLWAVLHETVLRVPMGGPTVMHEQLIHIAQLAHSHRIMVQVLPFTAAAHALLNGMASLMTFRDAPPVVYTESAGTGQLIDEPVMVERSQKSYDLVRAASLPPMASLDLIESVAEEYTTSCAPHMT